MMILTFPYFDLNIGLFGFTNHAYVTSGVNPIFFGGRAKFCPGKTDIDSLTRALEAQRAENRG